MSGDGWLLWVWSVTGITGALLYAKAVAMHARLLTKVEGLGIPRADMTLVRLLFFLGPFSLCVGSLRLLDALALKWKLQPKEKKSAFINRGFVMWLVREQANDKR